MTTRLAQYFKLCSGNSAKTEEEKMDMARIPYASAVGNVIYLVIYTRPNLAYSVSVVNRCMLVSIREYWQGIKWMM